MSGGASGPAPHLARPGTAPGRRPGMRTMSTTALPTLPGLDWAPAVEHPDLLAPPVAAALAAWVAASPEVAGLVAVAEIDPALADTETLNRTHGLDPAHSGNCVVVAGSRAGEERVAACVVRADTRADVNARVRRLLDVRKASFLPVERATAESGMEHGGITPIGLPAGWRVLLDARVAAPGGLALVGSGVRRSKLLLPGDLLAAAPWTEVVDDLAVPVG